jgi:hypothetical protein
MTISSFDTLSFTVREVQTDEDLERVCELRARGYGRHAPKLRQLMEQPDAIDRSLSTTLLLCEDKASGEAIGTMRVVVNTQGGALEIEDFLEVPDWMAGSRRGEMTRLVAAPGADPLVKPALWKAGYRICLQDSVEWLLIGARKPALIKQYEYLGAKDMYPDQRLVPLGHGWTLPHRVFVFNVLTAAQDWYEARHRLLRFMVETEHPDIVIPSVQRTGLPGPRLSLVATA